jgi:hypothetical protein
VELHSSKVDLATRVEILTFQMEGLQFPAAGKEACGNSRAARHVESNEASDGDDDGGGRRYGRRRNTAIIIHSLHCR